MINDEFSLAFWLASGACLALVFEAFTKWHEPWSKPAVLVYGTVGVWYIGNYIYSGTTYFEGIFSRDDVAFALFQVGLFLIAFRFFIGLLSSRFTRRLPTKIDTIKLPEGILVPLFKMALLCWTILLFVGLWLADWQVMAVIWPPSASEKIRMFAHPGVGSGGAFLIAAGGYVYLLLCACFAVLAVLLNGLYRYFSLLLVALSWPYFWFDRTRNVMLALLLPVVICYWFVSKHSIARKALLSALLFAFVNLWFHGVMRYRAVGGEDSLANIIRDTGDTTDQKHLGLNMLEELCWMNSFIDSGLYTPNAGARYLSEIANIVPRSFWREKPMIGHDYAVLRGFERNDQAEFGIFATIATGLIGQGVANFGPYLGVLAAAFLMTLWTGVLSRLWCQRAHPQRLLLFLVGCGLTFNLGRDITLLVLWPFVFGYCGILLWETLGGLPKPNSVSTNGDSATPVSAHS